MKNFLKYSISLFSAILILSIATPCKLHAQVEVTLSKEMVRYNGKIYYAHRVQKGQTLYSIAKAYGVTVEELQEHNPSLDKGLKEKSILLIPTQNQDSKNKDKKESAAAILAKRAQEVNMNKKESQERESQERESRKVEKREKTITLRKKKDSNQTNSVAADNTQNKENTEAISEQKSPTPQEQPKTAEDTCIVHKIKWYEDLSEISSGYQIPKELLIYYNGLKSESLNKIPTLKIPQGATLNRVKKEYVENLYNPKKSAQDSQKEEDKNSGGNNFYNIINQNSTSELEGDESTEEISPNSEREAIGNITPSVFIPSLSDNQDRQRKISIILPLNTRSKVNTNYMDFYSGVLMAAKKLNEEGANIEFDIIDNSIYQTANELIEKNNLDKSDLVIGPIKSSNLKDYTSFCIENKIPIVSPLDPSADTLLNNNPYLFQAAQTTEFQNKMIASWVEQYYKADPNSSITIIWQDNSKDAQMASQIMGYLDSIGLTYNKISYTILQGKGVSSYFKNSIQNSKENLVIVPSNNEAFVAEVLRNIDILSLGEDRVHLFGTSKWRGFDASDINLFFKFNLHLVMPYYIDLSNENVRNFIKQYRALYHSDPSANAFSGYDITYLFANPSVSNLKDYTTALQEKLNYNLDKQEFDISDIEIMRSHLLQQSFLFKKEDPQSGFSNRASLGVIYNSNYTVSTEDLEL